MNKNMLLAEVEDILRTMPPRDLYGSGQDVVFAWIGRAAATIARWNIVHSIAGSAAAREAQAFDNTYRAATGFDALRALLYQARADLRMEVGQTSVVIPQGRVFEYFDEIRKVIETARAEVFFVDPYLDADFVSRYLPLIASGTTIRLLTERKLSLLLPAVDLFAQQSNRAVEVRSSSAVHDRFVFVDRHECYLSGASFKDGGRNAPATFAQISDGFAAMWATYEGMWEGAKVER
jgi:hypothetical protein